MGKYLTVYLTLMLFLNAITCINSFKIKVIYQNSVAQNSVPEDNLVSKGTNVQLVDCENSELSSNNIFEQSNSTLVTLGNYKLSAYCPCVKCCGKTNGITASGTKATANRTVAVDTNKISFGTKLKINGKEYIAEDRGGAIKGNRIDIFFNTHQEALNFGIQYADVYMVH